MLDFKTLLAHDCVRYTWANNKNAPLTIYQCVTYFYYNSYTCVVQSSICVHSFVWLIHVQALSNGVYKSVWHRAVVNSEKPRLSVASFLCPQDDALISPAKPLTEQDECGAIYRGYTYAEYYKKFWSRDLHKEISCLELFKNE